MCLRIRYKFALLEKLPFNARVFFHSKFDSVTKKNLQRDSAHAVVLQIGKNCKKALKRKESQSFNFSSTSHDSLAFKKSNLKPCKGHGKNLSRVSVKTRGQGQDNFKKLNFLARKIS